jgi:hypothetical protein
VPLMGSRAPRGLCRRRLARGREGGQEALWTPREKRSAGQRGERGEKHHGWWLELGVRV